MATISRPQAITQQGVQTKARGHISGRMMLTYAVLAVVCLIVIFPIYWMVTIALKTPRDIYRMPSLIPHAITWDNFQTLLVSSWFAQRQMLSQEISLFLYHLLVVSTVPSSMKSANVVDVLALFG